MSKDELRAAIIGIVIYQQICNGAELKEENGVVCINSQINEETVWKALRVCERIDTRTCSLVESTIAT